MGLDGGKGAVGREPWVLHPQDVLSEVELVEVHCVLLRLDARLSLFSTDMMARILCQSDML